MEVETSAEGLQYIYIRVLQNYFTIACWQIAIMTILSLFNGSLRWILQTGFSFQLPSYDESELSSKNDLTKMTP
jgi:hypothetical protein